MPRVDFHRVVSAKLVISAFALTLVAACGGRQETVATPVETAPTVVGCCIDDRWEEPPPQIGQTPPDRPAPDDALEPFDPEH